MARIAVETDENGFFEVSDKDVELLRAVTRSLGYRVRLWFNPPPVRGGKGPQPNPTQCKLVYEKSDLDYHNYVVYELEKDRQARLSAQNAVANAVAESRAQQGQ